MAFQGFENGLEKFGNKIVKYRKTSTVILIIIIAVLGGVFGSMAYEATSYPSDIDINIIEEFDDFQSYIDIHLKLWTDGPVTSNKKIKPSGVYIWIQDVDDLDISRFEIAFLMDNSREIIELAIEDPDSSVLSNARISLNSEENGYFLPTSTGAKYVFMSSSIYVNGTQYNSTKYGTNVNYHAVIIESGEKNSQYNYIRWSAVAVVIAAISFSFPATVKVLTGLFWGNNKRK